MLLTFIPFDPAQKRVEAKLDFGHVRLGSMRLR